MTWLMRLIVLNNEQYFAFGFFGIATNTECFRSVGIMPLLRPRSFSVHYIEA